MGRDGGHKGAGLGPGSQVLTRTRKCLYIQSQSETNVTLPTDTVTPWSNFNEGLKIAIVFGITEDALT